jgi:hypothetical protein
VANGGTGATTITANSVILGNGTSSLGSNLVAPGTTGNVLTSNGSTWTSAAAAGGGVTSLNGQTGAITDTTQYAIGSYVTGRPQNNTTYNNSTIAGSSLYAATTGSWYQSAGEGTGWSQTDNTGTSLGNPQVLVNTGTWRCVSIAMGGTQAPTSRGYCGLWVRTA